MSGRLWFLVALLLPLLFRRFAVCLRVDKCCPPGELLALDEELGCVEPEDGTLRLLDTFEGASRGLPNCGSSGYLVERLLEDLTEPIPVNSCLDVFLDRSSQQAMLVLIQCTYPGQRLVSFRSSLAVAKLASYRECCPGNGSVYDVERKSCVPGEPSLQSLLRGNFIGLLGGTPECQPSDVLVDYSLGPEDVHSSVDGLSITIPWNGLSRNVTLGGGCLDATPSGSIAARICLEPDYCLNNACVRKCCAEGQVASERGKCREEELASRFRALLAARNSSFDVKSYGLLVGRPCKMFYVLEPWENWTIGSRGEFFLEDYSNYWNHMDSCIDIARNVSSEDVGLVPYFCFQDEVHYIPDPRFDVTSGLAFLSCFFLLATLLVYICLPALQNLHGRTLMSHVVSLFFAYGCLGLNNLMTHSFLDDIDDHLADTICRCTGSTMIFCFHAAFFWLNVMCFDIWRTFGGIHGAAANSRGSRQQRNKFLAYSGYAWGLALVLTGFSAICEQSGLLSSSVGRERCWFEKRSSAEMIFFIGPISVTLLINTGLFAQTAYRCSKVKAEIKRAMANVKDPKARRFNSDKTRFIMNLKLFIVMGIPWLLENFSSFLDHYQQLPVWLHELFYVADVVNSLQGLWIFVLFVLKPKVYRALRKRLRLTEKSKGDATANTLNVQLHRLRKSSSVSTLTSNFAVSSTA